MKSLRSLEVAHNSLVGSVPRELGLLGRLLDTLDLSDNRIDGGLPVRRCGLTSG